MAKRPDSHVRRVKAALATPAARRRQQARELAAPTPAPVATNAGLLALPPVPGKQPMPPKGRQDQNDPLSAFPGYGDVGADDSGQIGAPGTLNVWGFITGEDYNPDLDGYPMFPKYDQMRRGDAQASASLLQIKLPFKAARKVIKPASDDPQDLAIADFIKAVLLEDRAMKRPFEQVLDHIMLRFDFGCSGSEIIWEIEAGDPSEVGSDAATLAAIVARQGDGTLVTRTGKGTYELATDDPTVLPTIAGAGMYLRVKDLAPRLPRTFYRWIEWDSGPLQGDLKYLQQFAPKNGRYGFWNIPAERFMLHTHRREGNNYYGMSLLRSPYPNWFWKQQLYRIDAIRHDRLGAGIFIAKLTQDYKANSAPLDKIEQTLAGLRSHDRAYAIQPYGVEYDILVPKGSAGNATDIVQSIEHHNQMIAASVLQQFSTQGQQKHGSFGQAKVTHDVFMDALEGQGVEMGTEITDGIIRPLCDANFDMKGRGYPRLEFADIASADVGAIATSMSALATAKLITPDDGLENWLRELHDAPAMPDAIKGLDRIPQPPPAPMIVHPGLPAGTPPPAPADGKGGKGAKSDPEPHQVPTEGDHTKQVPANVNAATRGGFLENGRTFSRVPTDLERRVFDLHGVPAALDDAKAALVRSLATIRRAQLTKTAAALAKKDARKTAPFTDLRKGQLPKPPTADYARVIRDTQQRMFDYGREQVRKELEKQGADVPKELAGEKGSKNQKTATSALVSSAQVTADRQGSTWQQRIIDRAVQLRRQGLQGDDLEQGIVDSLSDEVESGAARDAGAEVNEAMGLGRANAARSLSDAIKTITYSAVLDANTCDSCDALDGEEWDSIDDAVEPPNPDCDGRDSCRCVLLFTAN